MLALIYLVVMVTLGDSICRRFYSFVSLPHRLAAAFLSGLLISSWFTYLAALPFAGTSQPMLWGNLLFFVAASAFIYWLRRRPLNEKIRPTPALNFPETNKWDWIAIGVFFVFACVLEFSTFNTSAGKIQIGNHQWSDFGSTVSIMQSFALGHNFPTELPHFSGERIHYHFLFYFQAGNFEYLGLNPALSNNILSVLSLVSMLVLVMTLGVVLFNSRVVGRIGAALFFFHGSLSYIPFLRSKESIDDVLNALSSLHDFLPSGFPYRGELWGVWSQVVFLNQRHLASSVGFLLLVLVFIITRQRAALALNEARSEAEPKRIFSQEEDKAEKAEPEVILIEHEKAAPPQIFDESGESNESESETILEGKNEVEPVEIVAEEYEEPKLYVNEPEENVDEPKVTVTESQTLPNSTLGNRKIESVVPFIFSGVLLGLMPMWNSAVFIAAFAVLGVLFLLLPLRKQMLAMAVTTAIVAIPQVIYLKTGNIQPAQYSLFHWGYTIDKPTVKSVVEYLGFVFGFKWLLIFLAFFLATKLQRRVLIAATSLVGVAFFFQFSEEALANHKFLNVWLIIVNLFAAYGLCRLWKMRLLKNAFLGKILAVALIGLITIGGIIDFFPIYNGYWIEIPFKDDALVRWVTEETDPKAIFLSNRFVNHGILLAGRRVFYGHPYYAQSSGYQVAVRDAVFKRLFEERNPQELLRLLHENNISYVAFDNGIRQDKFFTKVNETVFRSSFEQVFKDTDKRYDELVIYKVPVNLADVPAELLPQSTITEPEPGAPTINAFEGGLGKDFGQFDKPRGVAADATGNLFVADFGNSRIQKFSPDGNFLAAFGKSGTGEGELREPNGIAVDANGNVYVADALNHRLIKFKADGTFDKQWSGPSPGFYGPRDVAFGADKQLYVLDQGRSRVVKINSESDSVTEWGRNGANEGEFSDPTGIDVAGNFVFVADMGNKRIQVFDLSGKFIRQWAVSEWNGDLGYFPDVAFDAQANRLYATSGLTKEVLVFDVDGNRLDTIKPDAPIELDNPSSLALTTVKNKKRLYVLNTGGGRVTQIELGKAKPDK